MSENKPVGVSEAEAKATLPLSSAGLESHVLETLSKSGGSPLATLKEDWGLWEGKKTPLLSDITREAAAAVGDAAKAASMAAAAAAALEPKDMKKPRLKEMNPELGRALMHWSKNLQAAGRKMAALMALQVVVMGIMSVYRRNVIVGCEEEVVIEGGEWEGVRFVYGDVARLEADILAATGVEHAISWAATQAFGPSYAAFGDPFEPDGILSVLRGVPWLSVVDGGMLSWQPPPAVAAVLDADPDDPTGWMAGIGGDRDGGEQRGGRLDPIHPCLQQLEAYSAHRDDVDFSAALYKAGFYRSAMLVVSRIVASAAMPDGLSAHSTEGRNDAPRALRGGGSPPPATVLEEVVRRRDQVKGKPVLIHRFEELAGFLIGGTWGSLAPMGVPSAFDAIVSSTPGLYESTGRGRRERVGRESYTTPGFSQVAATQAPAARSSTGVDEIGSMNTLTPASSALNGSSGDLDVADAATRGGAPRDATAGEAVRSTTSGTGGIARASQEAGTARKDEEDGRLSVELDSEPSAVFAPRFEAARFLADLQVIQRVNANRAAATLVQQPLLARGVALREGHALLVIAALNRLQNAREELAPENAERWGIGMKQLDEELNELCGYQFGVDRVLEDLRMAPGVAMQGKGERTRSWWTFDAKVVEDLISDVAGYQCERQVAELRRFLSR